MFTDEETQFLVDLLNKLQVNPAGDDAASVVARVHAILAKLTAATKN